MSGNGAGDFYEFFAGGGMARAGLGPRWTCLFANDFDPAKGASYRANWGGTELAIGDVASFATKDLPGQADLAWASFPCQDLSLAGGGAGLKGARSGAFWPFWRLMQGLAAEERAPRLIVLENVLGALTSHGGRDFALLGATLAEGGYRFGALVVDAALFTPQSRPRLFIVAARNDVAVPRELTESSPDPRWHPATLISAQAGLAPAARANWIWWRLPAPAKRNNVFADMIEDDGAIARWHTPAQTQALIDLMNPLHREKLSHAQARAQAAGRRMVGAIYRRTRRDPDGSHRQRAEIRFDDLAGCLRTPAGGSSRQTIMIVEGDRVRSRLLSPREAARLMGLPDDYALPRRPTAGYHLAGDGVAVPVVRFLARHILEKLIADGVDRRAA